MAAKMLFGVCSGDVNDTALFKEIGFDYIEMGVGSALQPDVPDADWAATKAAILAAPLPVRACNCFLPGKFRLTGPEANFAPALDYAEIACRRADEIGCKYIVFGSGGARNVPCVFGPEAKCLYDIEGGRDQFADFCAQLARRIAACNVTVVIEPLRPGESNIINYVWQGLQVVEEVDSPRLRVLADVYHMLRGRETPESLVKAGDKLRHCHIAASNGRFFPGSGDNAEFVPYFDALRQIGYAGGISCECGWQRPDEKLSRREALAVALDTLRSLAS